MDCASAPILSPLAALTGQLYANALQAQKAPTLTFAEKNSVCRLARRDS